MASQPAVKIVTILKRKPGTTPEHFKDYYENRHVPLILSLTPSISRYSRNYITDRNAFKQLDGRSESICDVVTETWFDTEEDFAEFQAIAARPETRQKVIADELNFLDRDSIRMFLATECISKI